MNTFNELLDLFNKEYDSYNYHLKDIEREIYKYEEIQKIVELMNKNDNLFLSQVKGIVNYYPELSDYVALLTEIESIYNSLRKGNYDDISTDRIRIALTGSDIDNIEIEKVLKDFALCSKLKFYVEKADADVSIVDIVKHAHFNILDCLTKAFDVVFNKLAGEIKLKYSALGSVDVLKSRKDKINSELESVLKFKKLFDENGLIDNINYDDLKLFYEWLRNTKFNNKIEVIKSIILKQIKGKDKTEEEIVSENREEVIKRIQNVISSKSLTFDSLDLSGFTEEERHIIMEIKKVYVNKSSQCSERVPFTDAELGDRKDSYFHNNKVEWEIVLADIENNLLPNMSSNRNVVMERFKYIIEVYNKEVQFQNYLVELREKKKTLNDYIEYLKKLFNIDNLYDTTYDYLFQEGVSATDPRYDDKYDYYNIRYFLRNDVQTFITNIEKELIIIENITAGNDNYFEIISFEEIKNRYDELLLQYHEKWDAYVEYGNRKYEVEEELDNSSIQKENLVFCLNDISFDNRYGNYDEGKEKEFDSTVKSLETISYNYLKKRSGRKALDEIMYRPSSKINMRKNQRKRVLSTFDNEYFTPYRYSGTGNYRTGMIMFPLCKENKDKLAKIYNLKDNFAVLAIFKIIMVERVNHGGYDEFIEFIRKNEEKIENIGEMFLDPDIDIQLLCDIIDKGLEYKENLRRHGGTK